MSVREGIHQPTDDDCDREKLKKTGHRVLGSLFCCSLCESCEGDGDEQRKCRHREKMGNSRGIVRLNGHRADGAACDHIVLRPRAISYASKTLSKFTIPAAAMKRVP